MSNTEFRTPRHDTPPLFFLSVTNITTLHLRMPPPLSCQIDKTALQAYLYCMEIVGYFASALIGVSLGLIGGGGSILTVPVLVYLFGVEPVLATAYSLFIVGATSLVGAFPKYRDGMVNLKTALIFGIPAIVAVYLTRAFLVPFIPNPVFSVGDLVVSKAMFMNFN